MASAPQSSAPLGFRRGVERPRPLKCSPSQTSQPVSPAAKADLASVSSVMCLYESLCNLLLEGQRDSIVVSLIIQLNHGLKKFGSQAEGLHKEEMDKFQPILREACRDDRLDLVAKLHVLEIIELRAMNWVTNDKVTNYYKQKLELLNYSTTPPTILNINAPQFTPSNSGSVEFNSNNKLEERPNSHISPNASFQLSDFDESEIVKNKSLIEQWIDTNQLTRNNTARSDSRMLKSPSISATFVGEYKYDVMVGDERIRIYGSNANLLQTAKLVLDDYFGEHKLKEPGSKGFQPVEVKTHQTSTPVRKVSNSVSIKRQPLHPASTQEAILAVEANPSSPAEMEARSRRAAFVKPNIPDDNNNSQKVEEKSEAPKEISFRYDSKVLKDLATSPDSLKPPMEWERIVTEFPFIERGKATAEEPKNYSRGNSYEKRGGNTWDHETNSQAHYTRA